MKRILVPLFLFLLISPVFALRITDYDVLANIEEDTVHETRTFTFASTETKFDLFVLSSVSNLRVKGSSGSDITCTVERQTLGDLITCDNFQETGLTMDFDSNGLVEKKKNFRIFSYQYVLTRPTDKFHLKVKLPFGSVFADEKELEGTGLRPFKPLGGIQGTDGRKMYIEWELMGPPLGQTLDVQVIFEPSVELSPSIMAITIVAVIVMIAVFLYMSRRSSTVETIMPVLDSDEKKVVNLLMDGEKTQKQIARDGDFSKPKASRLISNLVKRGIVEKTPAGRTNKIRLKESFEEVKKEEAKKEEEDLSKKFYKKE